MNVIIVILYTLIVIVSVLLIGLVLIQQSKGGGFGTAFGGVGESVFGAHAGSHLTKLTVILVSIFFVLALSLAILTGHRGTPASILEKDVANSLKTSAPVASDSKSETSVLMEVKKSADAVVPASTQPSAVAAEPAKSEK